MDSFVRMLGFFSGKPKIDNLVFWIHYRVTSIILVIFIAIVGYEVYCGVPMACTTYDDIDSCSLNRYCSLLSTYIIVDDWHKTVREDVIYPGIGKYHPNAERKFYDNYHRVLLVLCLQAVFFYLSRFFWKRIEGGKIFFLTHALRSPFTSQDEREYQKRFIAEYLATNKKNHLLYFVFYSLAELMNFVNVVAQVIFINSFWGGEFGKEALKHGKDIWFTKDRTDGLLQIFPRFTKCSYNTYGSSGDPRIHSAMCIMFMNAMYEKIYVFLWFWCSVLAFISLVALVYRVLTIIPKFRCTITYFRARVVNINYLQAIVGHCGLGDWLVLDLLAKNLDPVSFKDVTELLIHRLGLQEKYGPQSLLKDDSHLL